MAIYEITGYQTGVSQSGVNYLQPADAFQNIINGFIYRQVLQSRQGAGYFAPRLVEKTRVYGIFEHILPDGTTQLLVFDKNFLYKYNTTSGIFDKITFAGALAGYAGFDIQSNDFYISGVSYPDKDNEPRFVFTGVGIALSGTSAIFFYDGTNVLDYTALGDNPEYVPPPMQTINRAKYVTFFNGRLNFISPQITIGLGTVTYNQAILYSGIRDSSGNGDKFSVAGSGMLEADTSESINGFARLGQVLALNFSRSNWVAEKTRDAFNPYFIRKVPSVLGTSASFSTVSWGDTCRSLGKTGVIGTDGRESLRVDDKIPGFTLALPLNDGNDNTLDYFSKGIDQLGFNLTYGGFDRDNNQYLWSYKESGSELTTQNRVLVNNYEENTWSVTDQRFTVFGQSELGLNLTWDEIDETSGNESWATWDTTEEIWDRIGLGLATQKTLAGDNLGFIYELNQDYDDYYADISGVAVGATTTLTITASGILAGDQLTVSSVGGMLDDDGNSGINNYDPATKENSGFFWNVISATDTTVEIDLDSNNLTAYTASTGHVSKPISFRCETIPFNPWRSEGRRCYISHIELLIDNTGSSVYVDIFEDEETAPFKANVLCKPTQDTTKAREWISVVVDNEANFMTFVLRQDSPGVQFRLTSMRIHCEPGGVTSG